MKLPSSLENFKEWTLVGPMGPSLPEALVAHPILCVDGGARFSSRMDVWVGDGDSNSGLINCENKYEFSPHKSSSDLALAFSLFSSQGPWTLHLWGFTGGRKDHELLNIGEALHFLENKKDSQILFYDSRGKILMKCLAEGHWQIPHQGTFSLASIKKVRVKMTGDCQYPLPDETELSPLSSLGLSNQASGQIQLSNQGPVMVIFPEIS